MDSSGATDPPSPLEVAANGLQQSGSVRYWTDYSKVRRPWQAMLCINFLNIFYELVDQGPTLSSAASEITYPDYIGIRSMITVEHLDYGS